MTNKKKNKNLSKSKSSKQIKNRSKATELESLNNEIKILNEKNIKLLAEFDNFQRRTFDEKEQIRKYQCQNIVKDLLPAVDDIERIINFSESSVDDSTVEAVKMVRSKIISVLKKYNIEGFESVNTSFDPHLHEALLEQNSDSIKKGIIMEEYEKGYMYHKKILRHAKVVVSKGKGK